MPTGLAQAPQIPRAEAAHPGAELLQDLEVHQAHLRRNCEDLVDWFLREVAEVDA